MKSKFLLLVGVLFAVGAVLSGCKDDPNENPYPDTLTQFSAEAASGANAINSNGGTRTIAFYSPVPWTAAVFFACAAMPRNRAKRDAKNSRSAERGCSSVLTPPNRRRTVGASNPALPLAGYAAPYAAETSRYVPPLYTYPTKFMHNLCHIVM